MSLSQLVDIPNRRILNKHFVAQISGEPVKEYVLSPGSNPGDNHMGNMICVDVKAVSNEIHYLIVKSVLPMTGVIDRNKLASSKLIAALKTFPREVIYYQQMRPILAKALEKVGDTVRNDVFTSPKHYYSLHDKARNGLDDYLVLGNLRPFGYKMADKFKGLNYEEMIATLRQLAILHATSYCVLNGQGHLTNELMAILQDPLSEINIHCWDVPIDGSSHGGFYNSVATKTAELMKEQGPVEIATKLVDFSIDCHRKILVDLWQRTSENGKFFRVLIHGDLWTNNVLFKYGPDKKSVEDAKLIDFQMCRFGNIYEDLHYIIVTSSSAEFRKAHLRSILGVYYQEFTAVLQKFGCTLPKGFQEEELHSTFRETMDYGFQYNLVAIPFHVGLPPPPLSPMTPIEVNFKPDSKTNQFFPPVPKSSNVNTDMSKEENVIDQKPNFQNMFESTAARLQESTKNSRIAIKRLQEMVQEMIDFEIIQ